MANENNNISNGNGNGGTGEENNGSGNGGNSNRRPSFTAQTFSAIFGRQNSVNQGTPATPAQAPPSLPNNSSSMSSSTGRPARRMSITTLGLNAAGTSPTSSSAPYFPSAGAPTGRDRRASVSTNSNDSASIDESAIEDDDAVGAQHQHAQSVPTTPFARRMSIGANAIFSGRGGPSPGTAPPSVQSSSVSGSTLFPIPARQAAHHESAPLNSSPFVPKRTASLSRPAIGPSGLSQGLNQARRTSPTSTAPVAGLNQGRRTSVSAIPTIAPQIFTGGPASVGNISSSLGRSASGRKPRTLSDHPGTSTGAGLDWSEQFRSRAESTATRPHRPSFGASFTGGTQTSPNAEARPMAIGGQVQGGAMHQRAASISDMSEPPKEMPQPKMEKEKKSWLKGSGQKPDEVGERILRGEFLMD